MRCLLTSSVPRDDVAHDASQKRHPLTGVYADPISFLQYDNQFFWVANVERLPFCPQLRHFAPPIFAPLSFATPGKKPPATHTHYCAMFETLNTTPLPFHLTRRASWQILTSMSGAHRMESTSDSGNLSLPSRLDSHSRYTGRAAEKFWKAAQILLSKSFWVGCGWPGRSPKIEPLWLARPSRSTTWQGATLTLVIGTEGGLTGACYKHRDWQGVCFYCYQISRTS